MSDEKKPKLERFVTPIGEAKWAKVHKAAPGFKGKGARFSIDVVFSKDDKEWAPLAASLMKQVRDMPIQKDKDGDVVKKKYPVKQELDQDEKPTGRFLVSFHTGEQYPPDVLDKYDRPIPPEVLIGNGSKVRVAYVIKPYDGLGGGLTLYLNAVQVVELVEYRSRNSKFYGFPTETPPAGDAAEPGPGEEAETKDDSDTIPFNHRFRRTCKAHLHHRSPRRFKIV